MKFYSSIFKKSVEKIQVSFESDMNNGQFLWRPLYSFDHISINSSMYEKCFKQNL